MVDFQYYKRSQQYLKLVIDRDRIERDENLTELIRQTKIDDQQTFKELHEKQNTLARQLNESNRQKLNLSQKLQDISDKAQKSQTKEVQTNIENDWMGNIEETILNLEKKIDELEKALQFKVEENAALKEIISKIDADSKDYKQKVTQQIEETLTQRSVKHARISPSRRFDINDDFFDDFSKDRPSTTVATEKDKNIFKEKEEQKEEIDKAAENKLKGRQTVGSSETYKSFIGLTDVSSICFLKCMFQGVHKKVSVVTGKLAFTEGITNFIGNKIEQKKLDIL